MHDCHGLGVPAQGNRIWRKNCAGFPFLRERAG